MKSKGRTLLFFHWQRPSLCSWSAIARQVALTYEAIQRHYTHYVGQVRVLNTSGGSGVCV